MSRKYLKTTKETNVGTYRMYRDSEDSTTKRNAVNDRDVVHIELLVAEGIGNIPSTNTSRRLYVGYMKQVKVKHTSGAIWDFWVCLRINRQDLKIDYAADTEKTWAGRTQDAFHDFIRNHSANITQALLDSEGEVFNPITNEKRSPYPLNNVEPLQETWIRISDDEDALARVWNAEFKKLAGAVVPVKEWDNHDKTHRRPQNNIWAVIDREHTAALGMSTGVGLPPRLWTIIDAADVEESVEPEQQAMDSLVAEIAAKREALSSYVLETSKEISSRSEEIARLEAQYKKHRHLDKRDRGASE